MNPLYNQLMGNAPQPQQMSGMQFANPMQKMSYIIQAMQNPVAFVKRAFPDIPDNIANNPNQILQYIQQTRGISNETINQIAQQMPRF